MRGRNLARSGRREVVHGVHNEAPVPNFFNRISPSNLWSRATEAVSDLWSPPSPAVGRPPAPMSHDELESFIGPEAAPAPGVGKPPAPMSHDELESFIGPEAAPSPGVGKPPAPMTKEELAYYLE